MTLDKNKVETYVNMLRAYHGDDPKKAREIAVGLISELGMSIGQITDVLAVISKTDDLKLN